jgi:diaminohydroxyphosphoribosylaminopyrimidine deaminase/5-amino-6-(5-phosphoribosylamino)uracil reductase
VAARNRDAAFLDRAFALAERGRASVSPNPMVGAVLVRNGRVVGEGHHRRAGGVHAEIVALRRAGGQARGADLYVTLEPCNHFGRTPPCVAAIAAAGVRRVVAAARDPNRSVAGGGLAALSRAGVAARLAGGEAERRARRQNAKFFAWAESGRPFVLLKWAASLDGKIAAARGTERRVTGAAARRRALLLREEYDAVLVGAGTVLADDPLLTRRLGRNPSRAHRRIVLDGNLRLPERARLLRDPRGVLVVASKRANRRKAERLRARGAEVWLLPSDGSGRVAPAEVLRRLAKAGVTSVLVEGGAATHAAFLEAGLADAVAVFLAPLLVGGAGAVGAIAGRGFSLSRAPRLADLAVEPVGEDLLVTGRLVSSRGSLRRRR